MKPKKNKKQRPNVHTEFPISHEACTALSHALLFMLNLKDFSFEDAKINEDSASEAEEKLYEKISVLTRGEVRATAKAIEIVTSRASNGFSEYTYMEDDFPGFMSDLERELPMLQQLDPVFQQAVKDLKKMR